MAHDVDLHPHPLYSPDLAPCDYWVFNRIKRRIQGERFADVDALKCAVDHEICAIPHGEFSRAIFDLPRRYQACIDAGGDYFE